MLSLLTNPKDIIQSGGLLLVSFMVFAESGMLFGFFLPGDTLLFSAGFLAGSGQISLFQLIVCVVVAAVAGCNTGYEIGKRGGRKLFNKPDGILFRQEYVKKAEDFYEKNGGKTIALAQFVPIARTFVPVVAGIARMDRKKFVIYNFFGVVCWGVGIVLLGDFLGKKIPNIDKYLLPIIGIAVAISFGPMLYHIAKNLFENYTKKKSAKIKSK
jgi:membrane-associated protein